MSRLRLFACLGTLALALLGPAAAARADFTVNDLGDGADSSVNGVCDADAPLQGCTLRAAIAEADGALGHDTISFSVSGTISLSATLPQVLQEVTIDGNGSDGGPGGTTVDGNDTFRLLSLNHDTGSVTLKDMRLQDGGLVSDNSGGAAIQTVRDLNLDNVAVTSNVIAGTGSGIGAGIYGLSTTTNLSVVDSTISANTISSDGDNEGAGIHSGGPLTVTDSVVSGNSITAGTPTEGGGVRASHSLQMTGSTVSGNSVAGGRAAGIYVGINPSTIANSTISGNTVTGTGSGSGGGVLAFGPLALTNVTLANNDNGGAGAGQDLKQAGSIATAQNTIFASSLACDQQGGPQIVSATPGHNIDAGSSCGFGDGDGNMDDTDPLITGLTPFGGGQGIHIPLATSPAIDNADPGCGGGLTTDQRGGTRPQGGVGNCDIGAYERDYRNLEVIVAGSGTVTGPGINCVNDTGDCDDEFLDGGPGPVLTATPAAGFQFSSWGGGACAGIAGNQCTIDTGNHRSVTASFTAIAPTPPPDGGEPTPDPPKKKKCKKKKTGKGKSAAAAEKKCKKRKRGKR